MLNENERIKLIRLKLDMKHYRNARRQEVWHKVELLAGLIAIGVIILTLAMACMKGG